MSIPDSIKCLLFVFLVSFNLLMTTFHYFSVCFAEDLGHITGQPGPLSAQLNVQQMQQTSHDDLLLCGKHLQFQQHLKQPKPG